MQEAKTTRQEINTLKKRLHFLKIAYADLFSEKEEADIDQELFIAGLANAIKAYELQQQRERGCADCRHDKNCTVQKAGKWGSNGYCPKWQSKYEAFDQEKSYIKQIVGKNLMRLRGDIPQRELAAFTGLNFGTIYQIERGQSWAEIETLQALAEYFEVPISEFFDTEIGGYTDNDQDD